jgi:uncharacterized protein YqjF (DUF2071 family)
VALYTPFCTEPVPRPVMRHDWTRLTFLHWPYDVATVQRLLPRDLVVAPYDGTAWVGLVPFHMRVRGPVGPPAPWLSHFPETNVRTYARGPDGRTAVWFFSLDAGRLAPVVAARASHRLPYFWSAMAIVEDGPDISYRSRRTWPGLAGAHSGITVRRGSPFAAPELRGLDHYLTARFALWAPLRRGIALARAEHPPWPLRRAEVVTLDESLVRAAGLPDPVGEPVVHYSDGVEVRIGRPVPVSAQR